MTKLILASTWLAATAFAAANVSGTITGTRTTSCLTPPSIRSFLPADQTVWVFFTISGGSATEQGKVEFYDAGGKILNSSNIPAPPDNKSYCSWASLNIGGMAPGAYSAKGYWNDAVAFTLSFWIQNPGLTMDQKMLDFQALASLYAKQYAPYEWKKALFQYDAMNLQPWIDRIANTKGDLDYLDILVQYVAALNDTHSKYMIPSDFSGMLGFGVDVYYDDTGKNYSILVDSITRTYLPAATYGFQTGDELLSIDGVKVSDLMDQFKPFISAASTDSGLRRAAGYLTSRSQDGLPSMWQLPATATVEIKRQSGNIEKFTMPWRTGGTPLTRIGAVPMPRMASRRAGDAVTTPDSRALSRFRDLRDDSRFAVLGYGSLAPIWTLPTGFQQRLGKSSDYFFSGAMTSGDLKIGYLRIPHFSPNSQSAAVRQFESEITFFQDNTDGLVLDIMRNTGGDGCYQETLLRRVMPVNWRSTGMQVRPTWTDIADLQYELLIARVLGDQATVDLLTLWSNDLNKAYAEGRGLTGPITPCDVTLDRTPATVVYKKPILLLVDEFSTSAADKLAAEFQDNKRGRLFGWRTNGAGGSVINETVGFYSEGGTARVVNSLMYRPTQITTADYPACNYVENVGVRPDVTMSYMRTENLRQNGKLFVDGFVAAIAEDIAKSKQ